MERVMPYGNRLSSESLRNDLLTSDVAIRPSHQ